MCGVPPSWPIGAEGSVHRDRVEHQLNWLHCGKSNLEGEETDATPQTQQIDKTQLTTHRWMKGGMKDNPQPVGKKKAH